MKNTLIDRSAAENELAALDRAIAERELAQLDAQIAEREALSAPKERSLGDSLMRKTGRGLRNLSVGLQSVKDTPNILAMGLHAAGLKDTPEFYPSFAQAEQEKIDKQTRGELKPETKGEEYSDVIGQGLAPFALAPLTGGASMTGAIARGVAKGATQGATSKLAKFGAQTYKPTAANIAGSVGASAGVKSYIDQSEDPGMIGSLAAGIVGGVAGRGSLSALRNNPKNTFAKGAAGITGFNPERYAKFKDVNVPMSAADTSKWKTPRMIEMAMSKAPGSITPMERFYKSKEAAISRNLGIETPHDLEHAVKNPPYHLAKEGAEKYHTRVSNAYNVRQSNVDPFIERVLSEHQKADVSDLMKTLQDKRDLYSPRAKADFDKTPDGKLRAKLIKYHEHIPEKGKPGSKRYKAARNEVNFNEIVDLRKEAQKQQESLMAPTGKKTTASVEASARKHLLKDEEAKFIKENATPEVVHNDEQARAIWAKYRGHRKKGQSGDHYITEKPISDYVADITGAPDDAKAFDQLTKSHKTLSIVRQGLPKEKRPELFSAINAHMGKRQGRYNINTAHSDYVSMSPEARKELLKTAPSKEAARGYEKTMDLIGENKRDMEKLANTSGTAHSTEMINLIKRYGAASAGILIGGYAAPLKLAGTAAALNVGSKLWTNQKLLERMNKVSLLKDPAKRKQAQYNILRQATVQTGNQSKESKRKIPLFDVGKGRYVKDEER